MKTNKLNLLILDDNSVIAGPLTKYLNTRFGSRINLSVFIDGNECMNHINEDSHVLILNYVIHENDKGAHGRGEIFKTIKRQNPGTEVTMLTSKQNILDATEEMQKRTGEYIRKQERYLYDTLRMLNKAVISPIHTHIILPVRKLVKDYTIIGYVLMILAAFGTVGVMVIAALEVIKLFR